MSNEQIAKAAPIQLDFEQRLQSAMLPAEPTVYSVGALVRLAARHVEGRFAEVWVEGEVSNLRVPASGHAYFTLKDADAQLAAVMFRSTVQRLGFRLEDGQVLRCRGRLTIYEVQGRFQLTAEHAEPVGLGALQLAFEQLKRKLGAEGLFGPQHKQPLPLLPRTIAIVTSSTGAALHDILRVLARRCPVRVVVCPAAVQGAEAPAEICAALRRADALAVDVIIVGRGGGSLEDLAAFNDEQVARTIFALRTPTISAVGHEVDVTIADLVADCRAPTPSAAAEIAVPVLADLQQQLLTWKVRLGRATTQQIHRGLLRLERLRGRLGSPRGLVDRRRMQLDDQSVRLQAEMQRVLRRRHDLLIALQRRIDAQHPQARLARQRGHLQQLDARLRGLLQTRLQSAHADLGRSVAALAALSPLDVLARGYGVVVDESGRAVRDASTVAHGDHLRVRLHRGQLGCVVEDIEPADATGS